MTGLSNSFPVLATAADLVEYMGSTPANTVDLLVEASQHVLRATRGAVYAVDSSNVAVDSLQRDAMHDATIVQAAALAAIGWTRGTSIASEKPSVASKSLGGASVTYEAGGGASGEARRRLVSGDLVSFALQYLDSAGLLSTSVQGALVGSPRPFMRNYP